MTSTFADLEQRGEPDLDPALGPADDPAFNPQRICQELAQGDAASRLRWGLETFGSSFVLPTSFGIQSAVLLHQISRLDRPVPVIWVDTGYLPPETYRYAETLTSRLDLHLTIAQAELSPARMEALHGQLWSTGTLEDMELYLRLRKVEPLDRAMESLGVRCWASGVRGGQTDHRQAMEPLAMVRQRWSLRSTTCPSTPCLSRAIPPWATGIPAVPMTAPTRAGPPALAASSRNAASTCPG